MLQYDFTPPPQFTAANYPYDVNWKIDLMPGTPGNMSVILQLVFVAESAKAFKFKDPTRREFWVPKSTAWIMNREFDLRAGDVVKVSVVAWMAKKIWLESAKPAA